MKLSQHRLWAVLLCGVISFFGLTSAVHAQDDDDVRPSPPSIGTDIPVTYFGPAPSEIEPELIGPYQLLRSGQLDEDAGTITLPLYEGEIFGSGEKVWYIVTDTTDVENAAALGINPSPKLSYANTCNGSRAAFQLSDGRVIFDRGTVDFSPEQNVVPGSGDSPFPPDSVQPGSVGDAEYTPLMTLANAGNHVYNAPIVAFDVDLEEIDNCDGTAPDYSMVHDKVVRICAEDRTVTLRLTPGFSFARPVLYLSMDASAETPAALEGATLAPGMADIAVGRDDSLFSAVERLFLFINGPSNTVEGEVNPQRQGLESALRGEGGPLSVLGGIPTIATDYSPLWDVNVGVWTQEAIDNGYRSRMTEEFAILGMVERGFITGPEGGPYGSAGFIVNCPIVHRFL